MPLPTDTEIAEKCVNFLRKNGLGTATFIALNKQNYRYSKLSTPSNVPRLLDLIKPREERFIPAFWLAARNTLVADNLDQAMKVCVFCVFLSVSVFVFVYVLCGCALFGWFFFLLPRSFFSYFI